MQRVYEALPAVAAAPPTRSLSRRHAAAQVLGPLAMLEIDCWGAGREERRGRHDGLLGGGGSEMLSRQDVVSQVAGPARIVDEVS